MNNTAVEEVWKKNKARSRFEPEEIAAVHIYKVAIAKMMQQNNVSSAVIDACFDAAAELFPDIDRDDQISLVRFQSSVYSEPLNERMEQAMQIALDNNPELKREQEGRA